MKELINKMKDQRRQLAVYILETKHKLHVIDSDLDTVSIRYMGQTLVSTHSVFEKDTNQIIYSCKTVTCCGELIERPEYRCPKCKEAVI